VPEEVTGVCSICGLIGTEAKCPNDGSKLVDTAWVDSALEEKDIGVLIGGRYEVIGDVAIGGTSRIYQTYDRATEREVAVKMVSVDPQIVGDSGRDNFLHHARTVARLTSVHTVTVHDIGDDTATPFVVLELIKGRNTDDLMRLLRKKHRKLPAECAAELAAGVLRSLAEAHEAGLVHANIKPAHVVLARTGFGELTVKLLGFGGARSGGMVETPAYMAPEQIQRNPLDGRADLYSLGVLLYACLAGKLPFSDRNPAAVKSKHLTDDPEPLGLHGDMAQAIARFVHRLMAKDRGARPRTALDALVTLQAIAGRRLHAVPHLASLDDELDDTFNEHLVDSSGKPSDFLDAKTNIYGISPIAVVGPAHQDDNGNG